MNCETCNDRLLDLLYEELPDTEAGATRAHVSECASCKEAWDNLSVTQRLLGTLPVEEPRRSVDAAILAAARQKVGAEPERKPAHRRDDEDDGGGLWGSILRWLTGFAGSPQFVMATIMMLVVAIGLWYLPGSRRAPEASGGTVVAPDHQGEAAPSATLTPAEPLDLDLDHRAGRLRSREDAPEDGVLAQRPAGGEAARESERPDEDTLARAHDPQARGARQQNEPAGAVVDDSIASAEEMPAQEMQLAEGGSFGGDGDRGGPAGYAPPPAPEPAYAAGRDEEAEPAPAERRATAASAPSQRYRAPARQQAPESSVASGGGGSAANAVPGATGEELMPEAIHRRAQSYARANACQTAISEYQGLLRNYPRYTRRAQAMLELADCQARLGQFAAAESTLRQVERSYPRSAAQARSQRSRVEARRRATTRPANVDTAAEAYK